VFELGADGDTNTRTQIRVISRDESANQTVLDTLAVNLPGDNWYELIIRFHPTDNYGLVNIDGVDVGTVNNIPSITAWGGVRLHIANPDYLKTNYEVFDDVTLLNL
jgi:hypothetical protein